MDLGLAGKHALVTGSSRGTGAHIARALAVEGAIVVVHGNEDGDQAGISAGIVGAGGAAFAVTGDLTTDEGGARVVSETMAVVPHVDILVNNFGRATGGTWESSEPADFVAAYQINALSAVRMIRPFVEGMRARRYGRIVQLSTIGTTRPGPRMPGYYAAKSALSALTVSLARELMGTGVTVNTVSPGLIHTKETEEHLRYLAGKRGWGERWEDIEPKGVRELTGSKTGRMARPEEVADLVVFLASDRAAYLHGGNFRVDGGATETVQ